MFRSQLDTEELEQSGLAAPAWVDDRRLLLCEQKCLLLVDVGKRTVKSWPEYDSVQGMAYSVARRRLYVVRDGSLLSIDPATSRAQEVNLGGLGRRERPLWHHA